MMLFGHGLCDIFFAECFLILLIEPFLFRPWLNSMEHWHQYFKMGCCYAQLLEKFVYPNEFFGWNNWYKGSKQTIQLIINVAMNQPPPC
jgi:hypothetical protein